MKKYVKPELFFEDFELSHNIASCNLNPDFDKPKQGNPDDCTFDAGLVFFNKANLSCEEKVDLDPASISDFCYQTNVDGFNVFNS